MSDQDRIVFDGVEITQTQVDEWFNKLGEAERNHIQKIKIDFQHPKNENRTKPSIYSTTMPVQPESSLYKFVSNIKEELFSRIQSEQDGEMTLEEYTEKVIDVLHEEIDYAVTTEYLGDVEKLVYEYGIHKALCLYINENAFGAEALGNITQENGQYSRCLLYMIVKEKLTYSYDEYNLWCESA